MGYFDIPGLRQYIKLRMSGDRKGQWPALPADYKQIFENAYSVLERTAWDLFAGLCHFTKTNALLDIMNEVEECTHEMSSLSVIHYYRSKVDEESTNAGLRDVCDEHTDTGILTLILCSQESGLQVWDRKNGKWLEIEDELIKKFKLSKDEHLVICILGEKIGMFTGSKQLSSTLHRVMVAPNVERYSMLYFMDTSK